jgi:hypothetical protein
MIHKRNAPGRWNGARAQDRHYAKSNSNPVRPVAEFAARSLAFAFRNVPAEQHAELRAWVDSIVGGAK